MLQSWVMLSARHAESARLVPYAPDGFRASLPVEDGLTKHIRGFKTRDSRGPRTMKR